MKRIRLSITVGLLSCARAVLMVAATTAILLLGGRDTPRTFIALCYLIPVGWSAARWGPKSAASAALAALLAFDLFFESPARPVEHLAAWLLLAVLLTGANVALSRIQRSLTDGRANVYGEYLDGFAHELQIALAGLNTQQAVAQTVGDHLRRMLQARFVEVVTRPKQALSATTRSPWEGLPGDKPDRVLPMRAAPGLMGEIRLWQNNSWLPSEDSYLLQSLATQAALALGRTRSEEGSARRSRQAGKG